MLLDVAVAASGLFVLAAVYLALAPGDRDAPGCGSCGTERDPTLCGGCGPPERPGGGSAGPGGTARGRGGRGAPP